MIVDKPYRFNISGMFQRGLIMAQNNQIRFEAFHFHSYYDLKFLPADLDEIPQFILQTLSKFLILNCLQKEKR